MATLQITLVVLLGLSSISFAIIIGTPPNGQIIFDAYSENQIITCTVVDQPSYENVKWTTTHVGETSVTEICTGLPSGLGNCTDECYTIDSPKKHDLTIKNVTYNKAGIYNCIATAAAAADTETYTSNVSVLAAEAECSPVEIDVSLNTKVSLSCSILLSSIDESLTPSLEWSHGNMTVNSTAVTATTVTVNGVQVVNYTHTFEIEANKVVADKEYTCTVSLPGANNRTCTPTVTVMNGASELMSLGLLTILAALLSSWLAL